MIKSIAFQTKARTLDHLGREQIADCPTAISELWKNSFDAYARSVYLDIFDGSEPVAAVVDDGHGMSRREFVDKWLVVGTESKAVDAPPDLDDRNGLDFRPTLAPAKPREFAERQLARNSALLSRRITGWRKRIDALQKEEFARMLALIDQRNKAFHLQISPLLDSLDRDELTVPMLVKMMDELRERMDTENANLFEPYIGALESLGESIDLEHLANFGIEEVNELRQELDRLNSLAQLGIAVEIIGHEMESYDDMIRSGLNRLPAEARLSSAAKDIEFGCEGLTDQLRFLSPLKLSGHRPTIWITGEQIFNYIKDFFGPLFVRAAVSFEATPEFRQFRVYDQPSRLYPVFINLVNNSLYWVGVNEPPRKILLSAGKNRVIVSDTGPGVDEDDVGSLFAFLLAMALSILVVNGAVPGGNRSGALPSGHSAG
jgi:signal transduction histidine kinase